MFNAYNRKGSTVRAVSLSDADCLLLLVLLFLLLDIQRV